AAGREHPGHAARHRRALPEHAAVRRHRRGHERGRAGDLAFHARRPAQDLRPGTMKVISERAGAAARAFEALKNFNFQSRYAERRGQADIADFTFGNPHEMPLPGLVEAIREGAVPQDKNWFAYKTSEEAPQAFVAGVLARELDLAFEPHDVALT